MRSFMVFLTAAACVLGSGATYGQICGEQLFKLLADDGVMFDSLGVSVVISGTTAIIGAPGGGDNETGCAYLFDVSTGEQLFKLLADDGARYDYFGWSAAISGTTAIIGAYDGGDSDTGSAYFFDLTTGEQLFKFLANDGTYDDEFGMSVAISGTTAIVGAPGDDLYESKSGSAYLFDVTTGEQLFKLLPNDGGHKHAFGGSVAISGTTAIIGASGNSDYGFYSGSAYLFDVTTGRQLLKLLPDDGAAGDRFGVSVAISGTTAVIGAYGDDAGRGSVYLFDVTTGRQLLKLLPDDGAAGDAFGIRVAINGTIVIVGAYADDVTRGSAYLFDVTTGRQLFKLLPDDGAAGDGFGLSVAISGTTAVIGASGDDDHGHDSGSAYLFDTGCGSRCSGRQRIRKTSCKCPEVQKLVARGTADAGQEIVVRVGNDLGYQAVTANGLGKWKAVFMNTVACGMEFQIAATFDCGTRKSIHSMCASKFTDACADAVELPIPLTERGSTRNETIDEGFPACGQGTEVTAPGVWCKVVGTGRRMQADTCSFANFDTKLNVYENGCDVPACVVGNNNSCGQLSAVVWDSVEGVEYWILVHGAPYAVGEFDLAVFDAPVEIECDRVDRLELSCDGQPAELTATLNTSLPEGTIFHVTANGEATLPARVGNGGVATAVFQDLEPGRKTVCVDECPLICSALGCPGIEFTDACENAVQVPIPLTERGSTRNATIDEGFPGCGQGTEVIAPGVWCKVVGTGRRMQANTCSFANFNTKLNVYKNGCDVPACVVGNNNSCGQLSAVAWNSVEGVEYWILVHGTLNEVGEFELAVFDGG